MVFQSSASVGTPDLLDEEEAKKTELKTKALQEKVTDRKSVV